MDLCPYGVVFRREGAETHRRDPSMPIRHLAANLRHELNPILSFVVNETVKIDATVSAHSIDATSPAGRILGATLMLDDVIQMITGVHDFHPISRATPGSASGEPLVSVVTNRFKIYSLLGGANRSQGLRLVIEVPPSVRLTYAANMVDYMIAVLMDNVWKFSAADTDVRVVLRMRGAGLADLELHNRGAPTPEEVDLFALGAKADPTSKGFGYGLFWASVLVGRYNEGLDASGPTLEMAHEESVQGLDRADHVFALRHLRVDGGMEG